MSAYVQTGYWVTGYAVGDTPAVSAVYTTLCLGDSAGRAALSDRSPYVSLDDSSSHVTMRDSTPGCC